MAPRHRSRRRNDQGKDGQEGPRAYHERLYFRRRRQEVIGIIAKRYAKALVELSEEKKIVDKVRADLNSFMGAIESQPRVQKLFVSPAFAPDDKKAVIQELSTRLKLQKETQRFIEYLAESGRIRYVREVHQAFEELLAERQNRASVKLTTAVPVAPADLAGIKKKLEKITGRDVEIDAQVDPAVIGGATARIGSVIYDGTIKNQLDKMRERFMK
ncbi:MAG TPA: ATP synthase F1 subunit delta [Nitrospiraceae bacterium]|nr:ATP synthase F1 subunit delta [Nitrospiraceae bacterium]